MGLMGDIAENGSDFVQDHDRRIKQLERIGRLIERNAGGERLRLVADVGRKLVGLSKKARGFFDSKFGTRLVKAAKSPILNAGQHLISGMKLTTGFGDPEVGSRFDDGADQMGDAGRTLRAACPDDDWVSGGAGHYQARNDDQLGLTERVIQADQLVVSVLEREAEQIAVTRGNLDAQSDWLADMSLITMAVGLIPYVGQAAKTASEIAMVARAVGASTNELLAMQQNAEANAAQLKSAVDQYSTVVWDAAGTGSGPSIDAESADRAGKPTGDEPTGDEPTDDAPTGDEDPDPDIRHTTGDTSWPAMMPGSAQSPAATILPTTAQPLAGGGGTGPSGTGPSGTQAGRMPLGSNAAVADPSTAGALTGTMLGTLSSMLGPLLSSLAGVGQTAAGAGQTAQQPAAEAIQAAQPAGPGHKAEVTAADIEEPEDRDARDDDANPAEFDDPGADVDPAATRGQRDGTVDDKTVDENGETGRDGAAKTRPPIFAAGVQHGVGEASPVQVGGVYDGRPGPAAG